METKTFSIRHSSLTILTLLLFAVQLVGCAGQGSMFVSEKLPTIAHVHIGHALTGWRKTPDKKGLFVVAEEMGAKALADANTITMQSSDLEMVKELTRVLLNDIDPIALDPDSTDFGLKKALLQSVHHITFAAKSDDASKNIIDFAKPFKEKSSVILNRCELIVVIGMGILEAETMIEAKVFTNELVQLAQMNITGTANGDEPGLEQLRDDLDEMLDREDPPYQPVATRYLFGIIQLPDGKWMFSWLLDPAYDSSQVSDGY